MECGVPFCHHGCPLGNLIPDWNDLVYRDRQREAIAQLHRTNNFPEFTGRLCPAPCEAACVLEIDEGNAVSIKQIELAIVDRAWQEGWVQPIPSQRRTGRSVGVVGSGPAGLACAQQLARAGEHVVVYERDEAAGGLVRFGVPEFKIEKRIVERRVDQLRAEGVEFRFGVDVGATTAADDLLAAHDAVVLAAGARVPRDLPVPGRELDGVHFAMEYLYDRARAIVERRGRDHRRGKARPRDRRRRHRRRLCRPRASRRRRLRHADRAARRAARFTRRRRDAVAALADEAPHVVRAQGGRRARRSRSRPRGCPVRTGACGASTGSSNTGVPPFDLVPGTEEERPAELVLLAMGFLGPERTLLDAFGVERTLAGTSTRRRFATSVDGVFAAGDARRGQSLIVWAIDEGRQCAEAVRTWLDERRAGRLEPDFRFDSNCPGPAE